MRPRARAGLLLFAATLAACGDSLIDHRDTDVRQFQQPTTCAENLIQCGNECRSQNPADVGYVCGVACTPCSDPLPAGAARTCTPTGPGGHDGVCGYECEPGYLKCADGCCSPALVAAGGEFACASTSVAQGGEVHCWGAGDKGQLGDNLATDRSTSAKVPGLSSVTRLAAGVAHVCAASGSTTSCWGDRAGFGGTGQANAPEAVAALAGATALSAGAAHTCGIVAGAVKCTGATAAGGGSPSLTGTALEIAAGVGFSCALMDSAGARSVWCWGVNGFGQLGTGDTAPRASPFQVTAVPATLQHVSAGTRHACASNDQAVNALYCWGDNSAFQIGRFAQGVLPPTLNARVNKPITALAAGGLATCTVQQDPTDILQCWAQDDFVAGGTAPDGEENHIGGFATPPGAVSTGGAHTCFVEAGFTPPRLRCFGHDDRGQLGDGGAPTNSASPTLVVDR